MSDFFTSLSKTALKQDNHPIHLPILEKKEITLHIKREDTLHPFVSGNKFRKLQYNLQEATKLKKKSLLTFGGAFSNHIVATAVAGSLEGFQTIGVIRGDELGKNLQKTLLENATLREAHNYGMQFYFISREQYRKKNNLPFIEKLKQKWGDFYLIPEGGTNCLAVKGCKKMITKKDTTFHYICCAVGTGGTIAGIINASEKHQKIIGFPALKGYSLSDEIKKYTISNNTWSLNKNYHFGGYGKYTDELIRFINNFKEQTSVPLDPIYTGKMLFGILDLIKQNYFSKGSRILAIHTGGLQGIAGINQQLKQKNKELIQI